MDRTTIKDIARVAGVSPGAVSFALNDKPGVSDSTRARVKAVAKDLGWRPNVAARALSANRAGAVGLVIARDDRSFAGEGFFLHLIAGMEEILTPARTALVLQLVASREEECEVHRQWW
ncbi:LacI family transcriptional regulator, partial [Cutibacterium acnes subsp. acnes]|nr:LacI family transcriptional regulator [Cutibacterium acnes subsp. acnes]